MHRKLAGWTWLFVLSIAGSADALGVQWKPGQRVELVVPNAAGGGNDRFAREIQKICQEGHFVDAPMSVVNKPGGGQSIGINYINEHTGDGNYTSIVSATFIGNYAIGSSKIGPDDITPIAQLLTEYVGFAVKTDSPIKSAADLMQRLKQDVTSISTAMSGTPGNHNFIGLARTARAAGADPKKLKIVYFSGGSNAITAALGGHVDLLVAPAATILPQVTAGKLRYLAITAPQRMPGPYADVPTWKELGVPSATANWRGIVGPRGLNVQQTSYWDGVLSKVVQTPEWKQMVEREELIEDFLDSAKMRKELKEETADLRELMEQLGLVKSRK